MQPLEERDASDPQVPVVREHVSGNGRVHYTIVRVGGRAGLYAHARGMPGPTAPDGLVRTSMLVDEAGSTTEIYRYPFSSAPEGFDGTTARITGSTTELGSGAVGIEPGRFHDPATGHSLGRQGWYDHVLDEPLNTNPLSRSRAPTTVLGQTTEIGESAIRAIEEAPTVVTGAGRLDEAATVVTASGRRAQLARWGLRESDFLDDIPWLRLTEAGERFKSLMCEAGAAGRYYEMQHYEILMRGEERRIYRNGTVTLRHDPADLHRQHRALRQRWPKPDPDLARNAGRTARGGSKLARAASGAFVLLEVGSGLYFYEENKEMFGGTAGELYAVSQCVPVVSDVANIGASVYVASTTDWSLVTSTDWLAAVDRSYGILGGALSQPVPRVPRSPVSAYWSSLEGMSDMAWLDYLQAQGFGVEARRAWERSGDRNMNWVRFARDRNIPLPR